jgi:prepilin peptidase CpaA
MSSTDTLLLLALVAAAVAAVFDVRTGKIPDLLTLGALSVGILARVVMGPQPSWLAATQAGLYGIIGAAVCAAPSYLLFRSGALGGGDVKLQAALGALSGPLLGLQAQFYAFVVLTIFVAARLTYRGKLWSTLVIAGKALPRPFEPATRQRPLAHELTQTVRCGPAIFCGLLLAALT